MDNPQPLAGRSRSADALARHGAALCAAPYITRHALDRYRERIAPLDDAAIRRRLSIPAIRAAIAFGAPYVLLASGHRVALDGGCIVTVLPKRHDTGRCRKREKLDD